MKNNNDIIQIFKKSFENRKKERLLLYGTGLNAERILTEIKDFNIIGVMDAAREGQVFHGYKVYSAEELRVLNADMLIIVARPSVVDVIYERIRPVIEDIKLSVYTVDGKQVLCQRKDKMFHQYYEVCEQMLWKEIEAHEVISFDVFDTLLMRKVLVPSDVFAIVQSRMAGELSFDFVKARMDMEKDLLKYCVPSLNQIYELLKTTYQLTEKLTEQLKEMEIQVEEQVLCPRVKMKEIFDLCVQKKKTVYLISDMYLTREQLEKILQKNDLVGYKDIIISCEYGKTKENGLFGCALQKEKSRKWLHIGDNYAADIEATQKCGIDSFYIMSAKELFENSLHKELLINGKNIQERVMLGLYCSCLFNNPFCLFHSDGKPCVLNDREVAYLFIAPCLTAFICWLAERVDKNNIILFGARDGYLLQRIYKKYCQINEIEQVENVYLLISRYSIMKESERESAYGKYLNGVVDSEKTPVFVDFMSRGTCQYYLQRVLKRIIRGIYFQKSNIENDSRSNQQYDSFCQETDAFTSHYAIFQYCDFLETIVTDFVPTFRGMEENACIYFEDIRSNQQLEWLKDMQSGILEYADTFYSILPGAYRVDFAFLDQMLKMIGKSYSYVTDTLKKIELYDAEENKAVQFGEMFAEK